MDDKSERKNEIIAIERTWAEAHRNLNLDTLENILSDKYCQVQADGKVINKDELLASYRSGDRNWEIAESDQYEIRLLGDVALLIGRWRGIGENQRNRFDYAARFLAVYHLENSEWKLVSDVSVPLEA